MAEPNTVTTVVNNTAATVAITSGVTQSTFARSLLSASFDQVIHGQFYWQMSDVVTLVCSAIVIANYISNRLEKRRARQNKNGSFRQT